MKTLLKTLVAAALVAFALTPPASAQVLTFGLQTVTVTNAIPATTTNSVTATAIDATRAEDVGLQISFKLTGSGTSTVVFTLSGSLDNSTYATLGTVSLAANGTNTVTYVGNYAVGPIPYLKLTQIANPNANGITDLVVKYGSKARVLRYRSP
ncbi:MAG: hypothetical protein DVB31_02925 [Verrucomicrobia bacterium]|nr:MAG: hypothetical protein DVB31_02925 [Verrucomicrobiota bacterium]